MDQIYSDFNKMIRELILFIGKKLWKYPQIEKYCTVLIF